MLPWTLSKEIQSFVQCRASNTLSFELVRKGNAGKGSDHHELRQSGVDEKKSGGGIFELILQGLSE
jgi:hypothetical protein